MTNQLKAILLAQFEASLCMLRDCIQRCPAEYWDGPAPTHTIAKYPFWMVAYHTLCFVDCYLSPSNEVFQRMIEEKGVRQGWDGPVDRALDLHPRGMKELDDEYPSRRFSQAELMTYVSICRRKLHDVLGDGPAAETEGTLAGPSGFSWLPFSRAEVHLYNMRHVQHHTGQLGAYLRRVGVELPWVKAGWKEAEKKS